MSTEYESRGGRAADRPSYDALFEDPLQDSPPTGPAAAAAPQDVPVERMHEPVATPQPAPAQTWDRPESAPKVARSVDTGRLYHSAGASGPATSEAIPALPLVGVPIESGPGTHPAPLTVSTAEDAAAEDAAAAPIAQPVAMTPVPVRITAAHLPPQPTEPPVSLASDVVPTRVRPRTGDRGLTYLGTVLVIVVPTLLVGVVQAVAGAGVGWFTGLVLVVSTAYAAVNVRRADDTAAIVVPALAFLVTAVIAGQLSLEKGGSLMVRESYMVFRTLATNAPWIIGATVLAIVIVLVRRRR